MLVAHYNEMNGPICSTGGTHNYVVRARPLLLVNEGVMMAIDIRQWLATLGMPQYADAFESNDIDADLVPRLDDNILKDIGNRSAGHRLRILTAIAQLNADSEKFSREPAPIETRSRVPSLAAGG